MSLKAELTGVIGVTIKLNDSKDIDVCYQGLYPQTVLQNIEHIQFSIEKELSKISKPSQITEDLTIRIDVPYWWVFCYTIDYWRLPEISINIPYSLTFSYDGEKFINEFNKFIEEYKELVGEYPQYRDMDHSKYRLHEKRGVPERIYTPFKLCSEHLRDDVKKRLRKKILEANMQNTTKIVSVSADNTDVWFEAWPYDDNAWDDYVWTGR